MDKQIPNQVGDYSLFAIVAFIFAFVFWPVGLVLGIIALDDIKKHPKLKGGFLAWIAIVLPVIFTVGAILVAMGLIGAFGGEMMHHGGQMFW